MLVVTKEALDESNTHYAQGGIAVAMSGEEDVALHLEDTINAGDGLVNSRRGPRAGRGRPAACGGAAALGHGLRSRRRAG